MIPSLGRFLQKARASTTVSPYWQQKPRLHLVQQSAGLLGVEAMQKADLPAFLVTADLVPDAGLIADKLAAGTREGVGIPVQDSAHLTSSWLLCSARGGDHRGSCCLH